MKWHTCAQFFSFSGRLLKEAEFEYVNVIRHNEQDIPFVSPMHISDAMTDAKMKLCYSNPQLKSFADAEFEPGNL